MQLFNRHVSGRSLTVFAFEVVLISGSIALAGEIYRHRRLAARFCGGSSS